MIRRMPRGYARSQYIYMLGHNEINSRKTDKKNSTKYAYATLY